MHLHILRTKGAALRRRASIAVLLATGVFTTIRAATITWDGGASTGAWGTTTNWSTNTVPANADSLVFDANGANSQFSITLGANRIAAGITFSSTGASGFTFDALNSLTLNAGGLTNSNANTQTFNGALIVNAAQTWSAASGGFTVGGAVSLLNNLTLSGSGAQAINGTVTNNNANRTITNNSAGTVTFGAIALSQNNTSRTLTFNGSGSATISGIIGNGGNGAGGLTYGGTGSLTLSGNNTYTGVTTISSGTVRATTSVNALGTGIATVSMGGGTLQLANDSALNYARNTTLTGSANITSDRLTTGAGLTHTLGTLAIGASTLTVASGTNVSSNTAYGLTFGTTTLSANGGVFDVAKNGTADGTLTLGALTGNFNFTKQGAGSLVLNTASTRSAGSITLSAGTLKLGSVSGLGTTATTLALAGGTLDLATDTTINAYNTTVSGSTTILSDKLTAATAGITHTLGTLAIGTQTLSVASGGNVSANTAYGVTFGATTLTGNATFDVAQNGTANGTLTLGAITDGGTTARTLTKSGAGVLTLGTAATSLVNGTAVNITGGTLNSNNATALGSLANVILSSGATLGVGASQTVGGLNGTAGTASLGANTLTIGNASNNLTSSFGGAITGTGGITKAGTGDLTLSGTNLYSGTTLISAGTLFAQGSAALGATTGLTTVGSGGTLSLLGGTVITKSSTLSLNGTGATGSLGALVAGGASGQTSEWRGNISLAGNATIGAPTSLLIVGEGTTFTNTIALGANTLTFNATAAPTVTPTYSTPSYLLDPSNIVVNSAISGTGGITKTGTGTLTLMPVASGGSTFTGNTVITGGKVILDSQGNMPAINSTQIYVGNSSSPGAADSVILQMGQLASPPSGNNLVGTYNSGTNASASNLTVYADGLFNMNGASNGFINLTLQGGHVSGGTASYSPLLTLTGSVTTNAAGTTALIDNGFVGMSANSFAFNVATGTTASGTDLQIGSVLQNGVGYTGGTSGTSLSKTGTGKMALTAANTFSGITTITAGILNIQNGAALGQVSSSLGSTTNGTVVSTGAQLQLQGGITVGLETLTLNGTGITATDGALRNLSGNNTYNGFVYLGSSSRINADAGTTLSITNTTSVNGTILDGLTAGQNLTVGGAGNTVINGGIGANITNLTKADAGTLTLAGTNGYAGTTTVSTGAVKLTNSNALSGTGVTVASGAALQFAQDASNANIAVVGVASTISGTGISNGGAIQNLTGTNSYSGAVTLAANSRMTSDSGSSFTMSGALNNAGFALDVGGAGDTTFSGVMSGLGSLTKTDAGSVTLSGSSANTFSGNVTVNTGILNLSKTSGNAIASATITVGDGVGGANTATLRLLQANQISNTSTITINGDGRFNLNGLNETIGSFAGTGTIDTGSATLITTGSSSFAGSFAGNGVIQVGSAGSLTFTASTSYAGELSLGAGTTLYLPGVNFTVGTLRITGNTTLDFGLNSASVLTATNVILENGATLTINNWVDTQDFFYANGSFYGLVGATSTPVTQGVRGVAPQNQITFTGFSNNSTFWQSYDRQITPAPEPATYGAIFLGGCLGLLGWRRFSRRQPA